MGAYQLFFNAVVRVIRRINAHHHIGKRSAKCNVELRGARGVTFDGEGLGVIGAGVRAGFAILLNARNGKVALVERKR